MRAVALRFSLVVCVVGALFAGLPVAARAEANDAAQYINTVANKALAIISDKGNSKQIRQTKLEKLFADNVDFNWVGRFAMGQYWRQANETQRARFLKAYQKFLTLHYASRFTDYTSGAFKVTGARDDGDSEFTVSMQIHSDQPNAQPILVDYRVRRGEGSFKIFDVIVEGVSMITTQRSEFASVIGQGGIDHLINLLETKSRTGDINLAGAQSR